MADQIVYEFMKPGEEKPVIDLVISVFDEFVAPEFSSEGIEEFKKYADAEALAHRANSGSFIIIARNGSNPVGVIEIRDYNHVAMLFVSKQFQRQGIARALVRKAIEICLRRQPDLHKITVNSSPNSIHAYEKMGFISTSDEQISNGIRFIPMELKAPE